MTSNQTLVKEQQFLLASLTTQVAAFKTETDLLKSSLLAKEDSYNTELQGKNSAQAELAVMYRDNERLKVLRDLFIKRFYSF